MSSLPITTNPELWAEYQAALKKAQELEYRWFGDNSIPDATDTIRIVPVMRIEAIVMFAGAVILEMANPPLSSEARQSALDSMSSIVMPQVCAKLNHQTMDEYEAEMAEGDDDGE
jgi:hypothetical protein